MKKIELSMGLFAQVDDEDFHYLSLTNWWAQRSGNRFYANSLLISMHRQIMGLSKEDKNLVVDHIDGDGLNNQKSNLRVCSQGENTRNKRMKASSKRNYKGVDYKHSCNKWVAQIGHQKRTLYLGRYLTEIDAAKAYDKAALELHGEFASLNFPTQN